VFDFGLAKKPCEKIRCPLAMHDVHYHTSKLAAAYKGVIFPPGPPLLSQAILCNPRHLRWVILSDGSQGTLTDKIRLDNLTQRNKA
jgi:hypothetical protein